MSLLQTVARCPPVVGEGLRICAATRKQTDASTTNTKQRARVTKSATGQVESMKLDLGAIKMAEYGCQLMIHANSANAARFLSSPAEQKRHSVI